MTAPTCVGPLQYEGLDEAEKGCADILPFVCQAKVGALVLEMANSRHAHAGNDRSGAGMAERR